jgi:tetratricopeptide (TPR) repeat protein
MTGNHLLLYRLVELMLQHEQNILTVDLLFDDEQIGDFVKSIQIDSPYQQMLLEGVLTESVRDEKLYVSFTVEGYFHYVLGEVIYNRTEGLGPEALKQIVEENKLNGLSQGIEEFICKVLECDGLNLITSLIDFDKNFIGLSVKPIAQKLKSYKSLNMHTNVFDATKLDNFFKVLFENPSNNDYDFLLQLVKHFSNNHQLLLVEQISSILIEIIHKLNNNNFYLFINLVIHVRDPNASINKINSYYINNKDKIRDYKVPRDISRIYYKCGKLEKSIEYVLYAKSLAKRSKNNSGALHQLFHNLGHTYIENGQYDLALNTLSEALKIESENNHFVQNTLANLSIHKGEVVQALDYSHKVFIYRLSKFGQYHEETAVALNNLGLINYYNGNVSEGINQLEKSLEIRLKLFGENHIISISTISNLSGLYLKDGDVKKAKVYIENALSWLKKIDKQKSFDLLSSCYEIYGMICKKELHYEKAIEKYKKSILFLKKVNGPNHQYVKNIYRQISDIHIAQDDLNKALYFAKKSLKIDLFSYGLKNFRTGHSFARVARIYHSKRDMAKSVINYKKAVAVLIDTLGENHEDTKTILDEFTKIKNDK